MDQSVIIVRLTIHRKYSPYFVCAVLNSKIAHHWFFQQKRQGEQLQIDKEVLLTFPIRSIAFVAPEKDLQNLLEKLKKIVEGEKFDKVLEIVENCLPKSRKGNFIAEKEKSDVVHDLLAFLAERMIEMNKENQRLIKEFLNWLEGEILKGSIEGLKNKTKIKEFYRYDLDSLIEVLKKNRLLPKLLAFDDPRYEILKKSYDATISILAPLKQKIAAMDNLIDPIVYKLYRLTEEEIKIVEEKT